MRAAQPSQLTPSYPILLKKCERIPHSAAYLQMAISSNSYQKYDMATRPQIRRSNMRRTYKNNGFTIVELLIAMGISTIVLVGLMVLFGSLFRSSGVTLDSAKQNQEISTAVQSIQNDLQTTRTFLITSDIPDVTPNNTAWNFQGGSSTNRVLLLRVAATTEHQSSGTRIPVYKQSGGCPRGTTPAYNNIIYYVSEGTLYRRIVVETPTPGLYCGGQSNSQARTCSTMPAPPPSNCSQKDVTIATNVRNFSIDYYTNPGDNSPNTTIYSTPNQTALNPLATIKLTISTRANLDGDNNDYTTSIRLSRILVN